MPLPDATGDEMEALLNDELSNELTAPKAPPAVMAHRPANEIEQELACAPTALPPVAPSISSDEQSAEPQTSGDSEADESTNSETASSPEQAVADDVGDTETAPAKSEEELRIVGVDDDVLAPYLAMLVATALGEPMPDEDGLALLYGSSSPSRVRRMLDHMERQGLIVIREEFGGDPTRQSMKFGHQIERANRVNKVAFTDIYISVRRLG